MITRSSLRSTPIKSKSLSEKQIDTTTPKRDLDLLAAPTPEKQQATPPITRRARLRGVALSVKEVRQIASQGLEGNRTDQIKSARKQIWPTKEEDEEVVDEEVQICRKPRKTAPLLPEMYEILGEFFDCLDNSIRLLKLKSYMATFTNVSPQIQCLTERSFTHKHLAQLKYILPEAIEIKMIPVVDERTSCMKPELHIAVNVDAIEHDGKSKLDSKNLYLRRVFRRRLVEFHKAHPQGDEVPEEPLPEPFNRLQKALQANINLTVQKLPAVESSTETFTNQAPAVASHLPQSFRRRFSQIVRNEAENTGQLPPRVSPKPSVIPGPALICSNSAPSPTKLSQLSTSCVKALCVTPSRLPSRLPETPIMEMKMIGGTDSSPSKEDKFQSTPAKLVSTPVRLMSATPVSRPPKRSYMSPIEDSSNTPNKLVRRPPRTRSLQFDTPVKNEMFKSDVYELEGISVDDSNDNDGNDVLPEDLLQSLREKERKALEERDPAISQAKRRQEMIGFLPKLFNTIHFFFQSLQRSVITKQELMYKIVVSHRDMVDKREIEEQLNLLLELIPDWISEKSALSGDLLVSVNKTSSADSIRARLAEAK